MTLVSYQEMKPKAQPLLAVDLPQAQELGIVQVSLMDVHCINPDCDCEDVTLRICAARQLPTEANPPILTSYALRVNCQTGAFGQASDKGPLDNWIDAGVRSRLDSKLMTKLRRRRAEMKEWGLDHGWRYANWSQFKPGEMVGYYEVFPKAEAITVSLDGRTYLLDDQYCCTVGCLCAEVALTLIHLEEKSAKNLGHGVYDLRSRKITTVDSAKLRPLFDKLWRALPELPALIEQRSKFMGGEFADFLREQVRYPLPKPRPPRPTAVARSTAKVGPNTFCPCGSGKKFKKCCMSQNG